MDGRQEAPIRQCFAHRDQLTWLQRPTRGVVKPGGCPWRTLMNNRIGSPRRKGSFLRDCRHRPPRGHGARACHHRRRRARRLRLVCAAWTADGRSSGLRGGLDMVVVDSAEVEAVGAKSPCLARPRTAAGCSDGPHMAKRMDLRADCILAKGQTRVVRRGVPDSGLRYSILGIAAGGR
jgi:hypothetical protein